ncbi:MAG: helix-turn-helix transcriptional regulator [Clostridia bacterium]|nr:helix-turn-helix transcriptional regulator [Clostridia bacterium]
MPENTYEVIRYDATNFTFVAREIASVLPHTHRELELGLVLKGQPRMKTGSADCLLRPGSLWLINPFESHSLRTRSIRTACAYIALQLPLSFFRQYFPQAEHVRFNATDLTSATLEETDLSRLRGLLTEAARCYWQEEPFYPLRTAARINELMALLLEKVPHAVMSDQDLQQADIRAARMQRITSYIEDHMGEKLLLGDLARKEGLTLAYLSHLFSQEVGMSFQTYLTGLRCRRAVALLMQTDQSLSDISLACGFSALKYMTQGFVERYGCTPAEFRETGLQDALHPRETTPSLAPGTIEPRTRAECLRFLDSFTPAG